MVTAECLTVFWWLVSSSLFCHCWDLLAPCAFGEVAGGVQHVCTFMAALCSTAGSTSWKNKHEKTCLNIRVDAKKTGTLLTLDSFSSSPLIYSIRNAGEVLRWENKCIPKGGKKRAEKRAPNGSQVNIGLPVDENCIIFSQKLNAIQFQRKSGSRLPCHSSVFPKMSL